MKIPLVFSFIQYCKQKQSSFTFGLIFCYIEHDNNQRLIFLLKFSLIWQQKCRNCVTKGIRNCYFIFCDGITLTKGWGRVYNFSGITLTKGWRRVNNFSVTGSTEGYQYCKCDCFMHDARIAISFKYKTKISQLLDKMTISSKTPSRNGWICFTFLFTQNTEDKHSQGNLFILKWYSYNTVNYMGRD